MKPSLAVAAFLAVVSPGAMAQSPNVDALVAFAHVYGVARYFHPSDSVGAVDWDRFLVHGSERAAAAEDRYGKQELEKLFTPVVSGLRIVPTGTASTPVAGEGPAVEWRHLGYGMEPTPRNVPWVSWRTHHDPLHDGKVKGPFFQHQPSAQASVYSDPIHRVRLGSESEAHVPVSMPMSATKTDAAAKERLERLANELRAVTLADKEVTRAQAHADGIAAWNIARHFYPYWKEVQVDWDAQLRSWLAEQPPQQSREQLRQALRKLVAPLRDGHARIVDEKVAAAARQRLPISVRAIGPSWVVDASLIPETVQPGDVLVSINGFPVRRWFDERLPRESGSEHFKRWRVREELLTAPAGATVKLRLQRGTKLFDVALAYDRAKMVVQARPEPVQEIKPGIWYVDLTRFTRAAFQAKLEAMSVARGIVFDLRGYPAPEAFEAVKYLVTGVDAAQWMLVPRFDKPGGEFTTGWSTGWQVPRDAALEKPAKVLVTDGRAISYAESIAAYFPGQKAGVVIGEATAGANGNVVVATLPSGMKFGFTGMRVTRHDGSVLHGEGIKPDVALEPGVEAMRAGRDEQLERAISTLEAR